MVGVAAHLVQRYKAVVAVERGVLEALGHDRAAVLLHPQGEADHRLPAKAATRLGHQVGCQKPVQEIEDAQIDICLVSPGVSHRPIYVTRSASVGSATLSI